MGKVSEGVGDSEGGRMIVKSEEFKGFVRQGYDNKMAIGGESVELIFKPYIGQKIKVIIEVL